MISTETIADKKYDLKSLSKPQLTQLCGELGLKKFRSDQIFQWLYQKGATSFEEMTNLSKDLRERLSSVAFIRSLQLHQKQTSRDGTTKYLYTLFDGNRVEAVLIPEFFPDGVADRLTVCVSSQVGCVFGCSFCATGKMGFFRNLTPGEIVDQITTINKDAFERFGKKITNIVYMGRGEPLHNFQSVMHSTDILTDPLGMDLSPKRITVSTVGLTKQIMQIADENRQFNLAISLHAASDEKRDKIMPINDSLDLNALKESLQHYHQKTDKPVTFEYLLFDGFNDTAEDARNLAAITRWLPSKVNIIMYNNVMGVELQRAREERLDAFLRHLSKERVRATVRRSRGDDIDAGCGQLAIRENQPRGKTIAKN
ncbi:MAG: 23S rRNA (adenine(2503)-C(2))-methyltransferase RlmN [Balneolales bacterium]|nr:23S rRNA (adenine(2503)-C(2))-methyltransferase RlmN [Balneolales bacterium]